ncbi:MAG: class I mannose-6-phosphate isomerase [Verrucomicrobia bacterium]|nr:class I mannose-6-phosphate isomerase [Verrucomicrobiota bacterium]
MLYPLLFEPVYKERIWGGDRIRSVFGKAFPEGLRIGESWEISDRPDTVSVIRNGALAGRDLRWLMERHGGEVMGTAKTMNGRFPLLIKILDSADKLSLQVHPPADKAESLGGEPKTEMWYFVESEPGAEIFAGLRQGVNRDEFVEKIEAGGIEECFHRLTPGQGDAIFIPSGRVHALGAGHLLFEVQQNSDTTYRVYDWNRVGADGRPRALHVKEALESIDFDDVEPSLIGSKYSINPAIKVRCLVDNPVFSVESINVKRGQRFYLRCPTALILGVVSGELQLEYEAGEVQARPGEFCLIPACMERVAVNAVKRTEFLQIQPGV